MLYKLNDSELRQVSKIYEIDIEVLAERLQVEDDIIQVLPFQGGIKVETKAGQNLTLFFKDGLKF
jgi:hypothetical protein